MAETTPPEQQCKLCKDKTARLMGGYGLASIACKLHMGATQEACLALIVPLENGDKNADPEEVLADIMGLGDRGESIDETVELLTSLIWGAAKKAADKANAREEQNTT